MNPWTTLQDGNDEVTHLRYQLLTVVQDQEEPGWAKESNDSLAARLAFPCGRMESGQCRLRQTAATVQHREIEESDPVIELAARARDPNRQTRFADSSGAPERHHPMLAKSSDGLKKQIVSTDEFRNLDREIQIGLGR